MSKFAAKNFRKSPNLVTLITILPLSFRLQINNFFFISFTLFDIWTN